MAASVMPFYNTNPHLFAPEMDNELRYDSTRGTPESLDGFHQLVEDINTILGPSNGIDSEGIDVEELKKAMRDYKSTQTDWQRYAFTDHSRAYTRNLVDRGNGKCNLLVLVWTPGKASPIHDHANAHCVMKILKGRLTETIYDWPSGQDQSKTSSSTTFAPESLRATRCTTYEKDQVTYMSDQLGLHRVGNPSATEPAVSLHLYTPPNAAKHGCHIFNEATGKKSHVQQCHFYSVLGIKS